MRNKSFLALFAVVFLFSCSKSPYREIDRALTDSDAYDKVYVSRIDSVRSALMQAHTDEQKWTSLYELFDLYKHYNSDSTHVYSCLLMRYHGNDSDRLLISRSAEVRTLSRQSYFYEAEQLFNELSVSAENNRHAIRDYFYAGEGLYSELFKMDPEKSRSKIAELAAKYRQLDSTSVCCYLLNAKSLRYNGNPQQCVGKAGDSQGQGKIERTF